MTKREEAQAEMLRYVPNHYFEAAFKACRAFERAVRDEEAEECTKVADSDDCLPGCNSFTHEPLCPIVFPAAAIRARIAAREKP